MQGTPKAIEIKGIVRNATVIGSQDGQAEDLINLRFMDGSWRASGDGRLVYSTNVPYTNIFVHTNSSYRHLLGVHEGKLKWFANIADDGITVEEFSPKVLCEDMGLKPHIVATGHMLTILNGGSRTSLLFSRTSGEYTLEEHVSADPEKGSDGTPYGSVKFRVMNNRKSCTYNNGNGVSKTADCVELLTTTCGNQTPYVGDVEEDWYENWLIYSGFTRIIAALKHENSFHGPFLACLALKMYDGKYVLASAPTYVNPSYFGNGKYSKIPDDYKFAFYKLSNSTMQQHDYSVYDDAAFCFGLQALVDSENVTHTQSVKKSYYAGNKAITNPASDTGHFDVLPQDSMMMYGKVGDERGVSVGSILHAPSIGSFSMFYDGGLIAQDVRPAAQDNVVYGKVNHLEFQIGRLDVSENLYQSLCVFVTPVFDMYDFTKKYNLSYYAYTSHQGGNKQVATYDADPGYPHPFIDGTNHGSTAGGQEFGGIGDEADNSWGIQFTPDIEFKSGDYTKLMNQIKTSQFYCIKEIPILEAKAHVGEWVNVSLEDYTIDALYNGSLNRLSIESFKAALSVYNAQYAFSYNGRLHLANYIQRIGFDWGCEGFEERDYSEWGKMYLQSKLSSSLTAALLTNYKNTPNVKWQFFAPINKYVGMHSYMDDDYDAAAIAELDAIYDAFLLTYPAVLFTASTPDGRLIKEEVAIWKDWDGARPMYYEDRYFVPAEITFFSSVDFNEIVGYINQFPSDLIAESTHKTVSFTAGSSVTKMMAYNIAAFVTPTYSNGEGGAVSADDIETTETTKDVPNGLMVSAVDNPLYFPVENYYQVGTGRIIALASNTIAVGTGQTGDAPLYVFCSDGIFALFVDASGTFTYKNARAIARDILNNPRSVTPIDAGVVFTTDRGLMMIAGEQVEEIGQPAEGDVLQYVDSTKVDYSKYAFDALTKIAGLPSSLCDTTDFLTYLQGAIVNYNHNMRELIVTNPNKSYSYVLDRERNWSRRDYTAAEYVNNYPTSYRVVNEGTAQAPDYKFYKLDDEGDADTSLEHRKEADNQIFYLSNVIKLDSIGFKQAYRFVVRGYFETQTGQNVGIVVEGSYDGIKFAPLGFNRKTGKFTNIGCHVSHTDVRFYRVILCGQVTGKTRINYMELSADGSKLNTKIR